jgi:hypothetical protein
MQVDTTVKLGTITSKLSERQIRLAPRGLKIQTGIKAGPTCGTCKM